MFFSVIVRCNFLSVINLSQFLCKLLLLCIDKQHCYKISRLMITAVVVTVVYCIFNGIQVNVLNALMYQRKSGILRIQYGHAAPAAEISF